MDASQDIWKARAAACELVALSFRYPDEQLVNVVASGEWSAAANEILVALGVESCSQQDGLDVCDAKSNDLHALRQEATRLFIGVPKAAASPYEGIWRAEQDGVEPLLFVNPHTEKVARFCHSCGLAGASDANEPLDHVCAEFELLQYLALVAGGLSAAPDGVDFPGGSAEAAFDSFVVCHLLLWIDDFCAAVDEHAVSPFYKKAAEFARLVARSFAPQH